MSQFHNISKSSRIFHQTTISCHPHSKHTAQEILPQAMVISHSINFLQQHIDIIKYYTSIYTNKINNKIKQIKNYLKLLLQEYDLIPNNNNRKNSSVFMEIISNKLIHFYIQVQDINKTLQ